MPIVRMISAQITSRSSGIPMDMKERVLKTGMLYYALSKVELQSAIANFLFLFLPMLEKHDTWFRK